MLIKKGPTIGDVVSIKIINGDEIIARFEGEDNDSITFSRPLAVLLDPRGGMGMIPWMFLGDAESHTILRNQYFSMVPTKEDAAKQYMEGTTGIALR
jgi:hypothetical protein